LHDWNILRRDGCSGGTRQFLENLLELSKYGAPDMNLPTAWGFVASD
jgi:hypothetical protein